MKNINVEYVLKVYWPNIKKTSEYIFDNFHTAFEEACWIKHNSSGIVKGIITRRVEVQQWIKDLFAPI